MVYIFLFEYKWYIMAIGVALATFVVCLVGILGNAMSLKIICTSTSGRSVFSVLYICTLAVDMSILIMTVAHEIYQLAWNSSSKELFIFISILRNVALMIAVGLAVERYNSLKSVSQGGWASTFVKYLLICIILISSCIITPWPSLVETDESDARDILYSGLPMFIFIFVAGIVWSFTKHIIKLDNSIQDINTNQDEISGNNFRENINCGKAIRWIILTEVLTHALIAPVIITKILETTQCYQQVLQTWWISLLKVISTTVKPYILLLVSKQFRKIFYRCFLPHDSQIQMFLFSQTENINSYESSNSRTPHCDTPMDSDSVFAVTSLENNHLASAAVTFFQGRRLNRVQELHLPPGPGLVVRDGISQSQQTNAETNYQSIIAEEPESTLSKAKIDQKLQTEESNTSTEGNNVNVNWGTVLDLNTRASSSCPDLRSNSIEDSEVILRERSNSLTLPPVENKFNEEFETSFEKYKFPFLQGGKMLVDFRSSPCNLMKESWGSLHLSSLNDILSVSELFDVPPKNADMFVDCDANLENEGHEFTDEITNVARRPSQTPPDVEVQTSPEIDSYFEFEFPKEKFKDQIINTVKQQSGSPQLYFRPKKRSRYSLHNLSESIKPRQRILSCPNDMLSVHEYNQKRMSVANSYFKVNEKPENIPEPKLAFTTPLDPTVSPPRSPPRDRRAVGIRNSFVCDALTETRRNSPYLLSVISTLSPPSESSQCKVKETQIDYDENTAPLSPVNCQIDVFHPVSFVYLGTDENNVSPM